MPATQSNWMAWPRAVVFPPPLRRLEIIETAATWKRMRIETMILKIMEFHTREKNFEKICSDLFGPKFDLK